MLFAWELLKHEEFSLHGFFGCSCSRVLSCVVLCLPSIAFINGWMDALLFFSFLVLIRRPLNFSVAPSKWNLFFFRRVGLYVWPRFVCWLVLSSVFKYNWRCWLNFYVWFEFQWKSCVRMARVCWPVSTVVPICACIYGLWPTGVFVSSCGFVLCGGCKSCSRACTVWLPTFSDWTVLFCQTVGIRATTCSNCGNAATSSSTNTNTTQVIFPPTEVLCTCLARALMTLSLVARSSGEGITLALIECDVCDVATNQNKSRTYAIATP